MTSSLDKDCPQKELVCVYALSALPLDQVAAMEAHLATCAECQAELRALEPVVGAFGDWPTDVLSPSNSLWDPLTRRIAAESGQAPLLTPLQTDGEPDWDDVAPGISCKVLASDSVNHRISMLVRLAPGAAYPPHVHAGLEELHLLEGELWIEDRKLYPGDYNRGTAGTRDRRVWSETGCTCVLITSTRDVLCL
jgi:anti-sigma factor ChrR (cupin superfamily)